MVAVSHVHVHILLRAIKIARVRLLWTGLLMCAVSCVSCSFVLSFVCLFRGRWEAPFHHLAMIIIIIILIIIIIIIVIVIIIIIITSSSPLTQVIWVLSLISAVALTGFYD